MPGGEHRSQPTTSCITYDGDWNDSLRCIAVVELPTPTWFDCLDGHTVCDTWVTSPLMEYVNYG